MNSIIHRDYTLDDIARIKVFPEKIVFMNPGASLVPVEELLAAESQLELRYGERRNRRLLEALSISRLNQQKGGGIVRIRKALTENRSFLEDGRVGFEIESDEENDRFYLTIYRKPLEEGLSRKPRAKSIHNLPFASIGELFKGREGILEQLTSRYVPEAVHDLRTWPDWELLRPHIARITQHGDGVGIPEPTASLMNQLAVLHQTKALYPQAELLFRRALEIREATLDPDHPEVAISLNNLALLLKATNRLSEAEPILRRALGIFETNHGQEHPNVATGLNNLAELLRITNRLGEAEPMFRKALEIGGASLGPDHPSIAVRLDNLASLLQATNRLGEAEPLARRALSIREATLGPDHPNVAHSLNNLALLLGATDRFDEAESMFRRAVRIDEASYGKDHPNVAIDLWGLATVFQETNRLDEAELILRRAVEIFEVSFSKGHPWSQQSRIHLERLLKRRGTKNKGAGSPGVPTAP